MTSLKIPAASLEALMAIRKSKLKALPMPVATYLQEAEDLYLWSLDDQQRLAAAGLPEGAIESLRPRIDLCRTLQARWSNATKIRSEAQKAFKEKLALGIERQKSVVNACRYAFRKEPDLLKKLSMIVQTSPYPELFQSLNDLAVVGRDQQSLLAAIGFNSDELDELSLLADQLPELYAIVHADQNEIEKNEAKDLRDRSFFHLKEAVDEIRHCAKYVFLKEPARLEGYYSQYLKRKSSAQQLKKRQAQKNSNPVQLNGLQE